MFKTKLLENNTLQKKHNYERITIYFKTAFATDNKTCMNS